METLKVRQVIFNFNKKSDFRYDVNQNIKILDLKRMIETALQIPRYKIKLYHNNIDYTQSEDSRLETLFPDLQLIEFNVALEPSMGNEPAEKEIAIKLRLGEFCEQHVNKYPCHFCFDCNKSFCSICNLENKHSDHETIEKYDYLQDTQAIVNRIFRRISEDVKNLKFDDEEKVINFESFLKDQFFDKLRDLITELETRIKGILNVYLDASKNSLKQIEKNLVTIKENCSDALNVRKEELQMQNMLIDESVIVNYYNTILQIYNQRQPIENDQLKFNELVNSLSIVKPVAENLFNEIKAYLLEKLNVESFTQCEQEILKNKINPVNVEKVKAKLHQDILNSTNKKPVSASKANFLGLSPAEFSALQSGKKKFHHLKNSFDLGEIQEVKQSSEMKLNLEENLKNYVANQDKGTTVKNAENISNSIRNTEIKQKLNETASVSMEVEESVWVGMENERFVFTIQPESEFVYAYSEDRQRVKKYAVKFPILKFKKSFLKGCAWVNANGKLYISGGVLSDGTLSNEFLVYDNSDNSITLLGQLAEKRANHSMFFYDKNIYILGGQGTKSVEIFNITSNTITSKQNVNYNAVDNSILWIHAGFIYSFFGYKDGEYVDFVQRANMKLDVLKWEKVPYKKTNEIVCNLVGSGIIPCGTNEIYFFGGKNENGTTNQSIIFNFDSREFSDAGVPLEQGQFFKDSRFIELGNQTFGQFSLTEYDNFLKINVSYA